MPEGFGGQATDIAAGDVALAGYWGFLLTNRWAARRPSARCQSGWQKGPASRCGGCSYGHLWWGVTKERFGLRKGILVASGLGAQRICLVPDIQTVIVFIKDTDEYDPRQPNKTVVGTGQHDLFLSEVLNANRFYRAGGER